MEVVYHPELWGRLVDIILSDPAGQLNTYYFGFFDNHRKINLDI